jgi:hypothetical protein
MSGIQSAWKTVQATKSATVDDPAGIATGFIAKATGNAVILSPGDSTFQTFPVITGAEYHIQVKRVNTTSVDLQLCYGSRSVN